MNQRNGLINTLFISAPFLAAIPMVVCAWLDLHWRGSGLSVALFALFAGIAAFATAKGSRFAAREWISIGASGMSSSARRCYFGGYACIAFGLIDALFSSLALS